MNDLALFLAQGMGSGRLPYAPGTWGTFFFIFIAWPLLLTPVLIQWLVFIFLFLLSLWTIPIAGQMLGEIDHSSIVIDEWAGYWLTILGVSHLLNLPHWLILLVSFLLFRFFDIKKPWPISWVEIKFPGSFGVLFDDLAAAFATAPFL